MAKHKRSITNTTAQAQTPDGAFSILAEGLMYSMSGKDPSMAILDQEARGQRELAENGAVLPTEGTIKRRFYGKDEDVPDQIAKFEKMGIVFGTPVEGDELFVNVILPEGWKVQPFPDHAMWSYLLDEKGRARASIFYKAAFYDRGAHISLSPRYAVHKDYAYDNEETMTGERCRASVVDADGNKVIYETEYIPRPADQGEQLSYYAKCDRYLAMATAWLKENFPDHEDPTAYW